MNDADDSLDLEAQDGPDSRPELPTPDFDFLIYSLRLQAELNMGLLPFGDNKKPDFDLSRHNIDLLAMLQEKTQGNLSADEKRSLDNSVTELRFRWVHAKDQQHEEEKSQSA